MRNLQSYRLAWPIYRPCFDFSKSIRANADTWFNIHEPSWSCCFILLLVVDFILLLVVVLSIFSSFYCLVFLETLNDKQYLKHQHQCFIYRKTGIIFEKYSDYTFFIILPSTTFLLYFLKLKDYLQCQWRNMVRSWKIWFENWWSHVLFREKDFEPIFHSQLVWKAGGWPSNQSAPVWPQLQGAAGAA